MTTYQKNLICFLFCVIPLPASAIIYTVGTAGTASNSASITPYSKASSDARHQYLILASELTSQGAIFANITSLAFNITAAPGAPVLSNFNINIKTTAVTILSNAAFDGGFTNVYSGNITLTSTGWNTYTFSSPFAWDGSSNLLVEVCYNNSAGGGTNVTVVATGSLASRNRYANTNSTSPTVIGCDLATVTAVVNTRPDMQLDLQPVVCNGVPNPGTINAPASQCANSSSFNMTLTGYELANGIVRQWYSGPSATGPWTAIPGANSSSTSTTITADTWYTCSSICTNTNDSSSAPAVFVDALQHYQCKCSAPGNAAVFYVSKVTINGTTHTNAACDGIAHHEDLAATPFSVVVGSTINFEIEVQTCVAFTHAEVINIAADFNHNSEFDGTDGLWYANYTFGSGAPVAYFTGTITIPAGAQTGLTRLRVGNGVNCTQLNDGNTWWVTQDYLIDVLPQIACSGSPASGTVSAIDSICTNTSFTVTHTNTNPNNGVVYQWQSAPLSGSYSDMAGQTNSSQVVTSLTQSMNYRLRGICSATNDTAYTTPATVIARTWIECYCIPPERNNSTSSIVEVELNEVDHTFSIPPGSAPGYSAYNTVTANIYKGAPSPLKVNAFGSFQWVHVLCVYVDYNHDGIFSDANEMVVYDGFDSDNSLKGYPFTVPNTALNGLTRMRIRAIRVGTEGSCGQGTPGLEHANTGDYYVYINDAPSSPSVQLRVFPEGFYQGSNSITPSLYNLGVSSDPSASDYITVNLHETSSPHNVIYTTTGTLTIDGLVTVNFPAGAFGNTYYIAVKHRNTLETWSKNPVTIYPAVTPYDLAH